MDDDDRDERERAAQDAARRWRARATPRNQQVRAAEKGEHTAADSIGRLHKRVIRLTSLMESRLPFGAPAAESLRMVPEPPAVADITDELVERVLDESDFLSVEYFERGSQAALCVGRILTNGGVNGTGFLVAPDLVVTNWHVLKTIGRARESEFQLDYEANTFGERKTPQSFALEPDVFFLNDRTHDLALIAVAPTSQNGRPLAAYGYLPLIADEGKITIGESVNIVQHPRGRIKQIVIRNSRLLDLPPGDDAGIYFHYEADTEKGSSGSPVFNDQWEVVALHHQGVPKRNAKGQIVDADGEVIDPYDEERAVWVGNEGIRTSKLVAFLRAAPLSGAQDERRNALLALWQAQGAPGAALPVVKPQTESVSDDASARKPEPAPAPRPPLPPARAAPAPAPAANAGATSFVVPLRISVSLGAEDGGGAFPAAASAFEESIAPDPADRQYLRRPGYRADFLGFEAPLPTLADDRHGPLLTFGPDRETELRYHHFSVLMNARRRLAYVAAVNLDAGAPFQHARDKGGDAWFFDPRIPKKDQAGGAYYASNPLDRGHLVRRDDAAWGATAAEAKLANDDTFHWTNCSPQHEVFNQGGLASSRGLKLWGNLESAVSDLAPSYGSRLCVFNGPVFDDRDPRYRDDLFLPQAFWKLILLKGEDRRPRAVAFQLSQAAQIADVLTEGFAPAELADFMVFQVPVTRLSAVTGLDFGEMAAWDPMASASASGAALQESMVEPLRDERMIRL